MLRPADEGLEAEGEGTDDETACETEAEAPEAEAPEAEACEAEAPEADEAEAAACEAEVEAEAAASEAEVEAEAAASEADEAAGVSEAEGAASEAEGVAEPPAEAPPPEQSWVWRARAAWTWSGHCEAMQGATAAVRPVAAQMHETSVRDEQPRPGRALVMQVTMHWLMVEGSLGKG